MSYRLEISQVFWLEDILVSEMIYAIVYDFPLIAVVLNKIWRPVIKNTLTVFVPISKVGLSAGV
jgi:hypothetical protein